MCKKKVWEKNSFIYLIQATLTTPLMYPCLSAKSTALRAALPFLFLVRALKTLPGPFLWDLITRPILLQYNILNEFSLQWNSGKLLHFPSFIENRFYDQGNTCTHLYYFCNNNFILKLHSKIQMYHYSYGLFRKLAIHKCTSVCKCLGLSILSIIQLFFSCVYLLCILFIHLYTIFLLALEGP